jgi:MFS family permease
MGRKVCLPTLVLHANNSFASAYLIAGAAPCPAYGKLSDIFGRKQVLYPSILIFLLFPRFALIS